MRTWVAGSLLAIALAGAAPPAGAEHRGTEPGGALDLGVDFGVGAEGFRLGGRLTGPDGVWGLGLGGRPRRQGFTLEGWLEEGGRTRGFTLDAEITRWWRSRPEAL
jgi:hypothetical protein